MATTKTTPSTENTSLSRRYKNQLSPRRLRAWRSYLAQPSFTRLYVCAGVGVLFLSVVLWAVLGAHVQQANADQLVNAYLFQDSHTFNGASWPGQHSFLLKWPLFYLVKLLGYSSGAFMAATVACVLLTVGVLAYVIYRIDRRPLVFGTWCLALASVLLLVPPQPYPGGLLPVNMAMLTTRNIEYVWYLGSLILLLTARRQRSWRFGGATVLLGVLFASDKLFLSMSLGGALLALVVYALRRRWANVSLATNWLVASIGGAIFSLALIALINASHITHITSQASAGPYVLSSQTKQVTLGAIYGILGVATNTGSNPASNATTLSAIPRQLVDGLWSTAGLGYIINAVLLVAGIVIAICFLKRSITKNNSRPLLRRSQAVSFMLLYSSLAALGLFIITNHDYVVDARYLTVCLFSIFILLAGWFQKKRLAAEKVVVLGIVIILGIAGSVGYVVHSYHNYKGAYAGLQQRDVTISHIMASHHTKTLVGDYWRVLPAKFKSGGKLQALPLEQCSKPRNILTSQAWQPDLRKHSFAYLLTLDDSLTDYPHCSLNQVTVAYGIPNSSALVAGNLSDPKELLLFYDEGTHGSLPSSLAPSQSVGSVLPATLSDLPDTKCEQPTIMQVVAHQDDDLLFMNPDLAHSISDGYCVRTVYLTAGDAGAGPLYWLSRERGSEAAYARMLNIRNDWAQRIIKLPAGQFITIASPKNNPAVSLIFMHLPDGNLHGDGFRISKYESLQGLNEGHLNRLHSVDKQSMYTKDQLRDGLGALMRTYAPAELRTQSAYQGAVIPDHSDHQIAGVFAAQAYHQYESQHSGSLDLKLTFYIGYPVRELPENVADQDLANKQATFLMYAKYDGDVCRTLQECQQTETYHAYLTHQYPNNY